MRKQRIFCLAAVLCLLLTGCSRTKEGGSKFYSNEATKPEAQEVSTAYADQELGFQLEEPKEGEEIAVITTSYGDIYIRLFPEAAPKAVENFKGLIQKGTYKDVIFHRVIDNFMIQTGDYEYQNGTGGKSIWGNQFEDEFDSKLLNLRGSLAMANSGVNTNGSQFFINQAPKEAFDRSSYDYDDAYDKVKQYYNSYKAQYQDFLSAYPTLSSFIQKQGGINPLSYSVPEEVWDLYEANGGNIHLDGAFRATGGHTVFGQVFKGMEVVDQIAAVEVDENSKPKTDVKIESTKIIKYSK